MKNIIIIIVFSIIFGGCCKENIISDNPVNHYCGVEQPSEDLDWLRIEIKDKIIGNDSVEVIKMEMPSFDEFGFLFQFETQVPNQRRSEYYYTCTGTLICYSLGGFTGSNCGNKLIDLTLSDTIFIQY